MMDWLGSVGIGAVGQLSTEPLPSTAVHLEPPAWIITSDLIYNNGDYVNSTKGSLLDSLTEQSVLTLHFGLNSDILVHVNNDSIGVIATVPRNTNHIFPLIDLYGRVCQVSVLLHPHIVVSGTSIDLPIIAENQREESLAESEHTLRNGPQRNSDELSPTSDITPRRKVKSYSHDNLIEDSLEPILFHAGPSTQIESTEDIVPSVSETRQPARLSQIALHHSLIVSGTVLTSNNRDPDRYIQKSHSSHDFNRVAIDIDDKDLSRQSHSASSDLVDDGVTCGLFYDTNIQHNDRYPEANDVDNLDNEIMDALTLETGNLPDLTEEQSSSIDESTRRDELWSEQLSIENLNYLNRILCLDQEGTEGQSLESEWEASGENCEHLHMVLKYWNFLVCPYPELRRAVSWGQVRCYCNNCQPDSQPPLTDWVRIERIDGVGAAQRGFWHVSRSTLGSAQAVCGDTDGVRRPRALTLTPCTSTTFSDIWFDEEGKPHHTVLAIEIDIEGSEAENDRLLAFLIYLKSHSYLDENPPSIVE